MLQSSYTAASTLPFKLFRNGELMAALGRGHIPPVHVQFNPTNRCNLNCSFCSCSERDQSDEMALAEIEEMIPYLRSLGCQSVTVTGGGEPLLHPDINAVIHAFAREGIKVGLVTNGRLLDNIHDSLGAITWCRVSCSDDYAFGDRFSGVMQRAVAAGPNVDWAFSYVLTQRPQVANLLSHIEFANAHNYTHVRVVSNILNAASSPMSEIVPIVRGSVDDSLVIWQPRQDWRAGRPRCLISLLKPVVAPNGQVYPCCGVQYAEAEPARDLPDSMSMGHWGALGGMEPYDGSNCVKCYYEAYNVALASMVEDIAHLEFV